MRLFATQVPKTELYEWDARDANTGLQLKNVLWADDETHEVARCVGDCAFFDCAAEGCRCTSVEKLPKVVISFPRKLILVNVRENLRDDSLFESKLRIESTSGSSLDADAAERLREFVNRPIHIEIKR